MMTHTRCVYNRTITASVVGAILCFIVSARWQQLVVAIVRAQVGSSLCLQSKVVSRNGAAWQFWGELICRIRTRLKAKCY